jgi:hypothetical protein
MSAFFLFSQGNRTRVKDENPTAGFGDIVSATVLRFFIVFILIRFAGYFMC